MVRAVDFSIVWSDIFDYANGELYWKETINNRAIKGNKAGCITPMGRRSVRFDGKDYTVARIIFKMHHGYTPKVVQYLDKNPLNTRIENLVNTDVSTSMRSRGNISTNTSGRKGVYRTASGHWAAAFMYKGRKIYLGTFSTVFDAGKTYDDAVAKYIGKVLTAT
jgi:hypothetical protein